MYNKKLVAWTNWNTFQFQACVCCEFFFGFVRSSRSGNLCQVSVPSVTCLEQSILHVQDRRSLKYLVLFFLYLTTASHVIKFNDNANLWIIYFLREEASRAFKKISIETVVVFIASATSAITVIITGSEATMSMKDIEDLVSHGGLTL